MQSAGWLQAHACSICYPVQLGSATAATVLQGMARLRQNMRAEQSQCAATPDPTETLHNQHDCAHQLLSACSLWFVRMPKPAEDSSTAAVEAEVEGYRTQVQLLNESLTIKRVCKGHSRLALADTFA